MLPSSEYKKLYFHVKKAQMIQANLTTLVGSSKRPFLNKYQYQLIVPMNIAAAVPWIPGKVTLQKANID